MFCADGGEGRERFYALPHNHDQLRQRLRRQAGSRWTSGQLVSLTWSQNRTTASSDLACGIQCPRVRRTVY